MSTPSITLTFRKIQETPGNYAGIFRDISRDGIDGHTFKYLGRRGQQAVLNAHSFFIDRAAAVAAITAYEAAQGQECLITNTLDAWTRQAFLLSVWCYPPERINSTEPNITYRVRTRLEVIRTV
jgi:hypothetical protein